MKKVILLFMLTGISIYASAQTNGDKLDTIRCWFKQALIVKSALKPGKIYPTDQKALPGDSTINEIWIPGYIIRDITAGSAQVGFLYSDRKTLVIAPVIYSIYKK
jgi:hypothetical protein